MKNIDLKMESNELIIRINLSENFGQSRSGKTIIIASTEGNQNVGQCNGKPVYLGLNAYTFKDR